MKTTLIRAAAVLSLLLSGPLQAIPEGPEPNTPAWFQRELLNYARTTEAPSEQLLPAFQQRWLPQSAANSVEWNQRALNDPSWLLAPSGNTPLLPLCTTWAFQCAGDPFRYPGVDPFYEAEAEVIPLVIYDQGCARLSGRVWAPKGSVAGARLPAVVIENGSIQAPEPLYWWMAQALVRQGYVVMTFDPRGQGRSDQMSPNGEQGSNANSAVFWEGLVNVIDFFRATPVAPYPHNATCADSYPTPVTDFNPFFDRIDRERLGLAGHSLGGVGVSVVQSYGAEGADPWPGRLDTGNPVKVAVAWDGMGSGAGTPAVVARVPLMSQTSEYGIGGTAFSQPPDPEQHKTAYRAWRDAGVPVYQLTIQGSTHFEWSLIPSFPATSWCPEVVDGHCVGGWGRPLAEHYSLAWFDRWLKQPGEPGYEDADARLLADGDWVERYSFYSRSARAYPKRDGEAVLCEDIRAGCDCGSSGGGSTSGGSSGSSGSGSTSGSSSGSASGSSGSSSGSSSGASGSSSGSASADCGPDGSSSSSGSSGGSSGTGSSSSGGGTSSGSGSGSGGAPAEASAGGGALSPALLGLLLLLPGRWRRRPR